MNARSVTCLANPTSEQAQALTETMRAFNAACNVVSRAAWETKAFGQVALHHLAYRRIRDEFGLPAQLAVRAIGKVVEAYARSKESRIAFQALGAITYDSRVLRLLGVSSVSCSTLTGRITVPLKIGGYQRNRLSGASLGQTRLSYDRVKNRFSFIFTARSPSSPPPEPSDFLGVDMGIRNVAADSDGTLYTGGQIRGLRKRHLRLRRRLQAKGTRGARRLLRKRGRREARFQRHLNHCISKKIVAAAKGTGRGVAVEELTHIRSRITVRKAQRAALSAWAFHQLRMFLTYKCADAELRLVAVDPRNTSRTCPACACVDARNRPSQSQFKCVRCGLSGHADLFAAENIRRAAVSQPDCSARASGQSGQSSF